MEKKKTNERAVYKSGTGTRGRGHQDACVGTWDLRTSSMGRRDVWDGDAGTSYTGTQGTPDVNDYCNESEVNAISLSS